MAVTITAFAAAAFVLLLQAIHVVRKGSLQWFFIAAPRPSTSNAGSTSKRVQGALWYGLPGCALLSLVVYTSIERWRSAMLSLRAEHLGNLVGGLILFALSFSAVLWPRWMLKSV